MDEQTLDQMFQEDLLFNGPLGEMTWKDKLLFRLLLIFNFLIWYWIITLL